MDITLKLQSKSIANVNVVNSNSIYNDQSTEITCLSTPRYTR